MTLYQKLHPEAFGGHTVTLIKYDSRNPGGSVAKQGMQEMVTREGAAMVAGFVFSPDAIASAPLATQAKIPMLVLNAATAWITTQSPYVARLSFTMWQAGYPMGDFAYTKLSCRTAVVGYTDYPPGKDTLDAFKAGFERAGGRVIDTIPMGGPAEVPDFSPFLRRVKDAKPNCLYAFVPSGNHLTAFIKTWSELGLKEAGIRLIGPGELTQDTQMASLADGALGMVTMFHYGADYATPANTAFVAAWRKEYGAGAVPDFMAVAGWDGMAAIAHAVKATGGATDGDKLMAALKDFSFDSPRGPIRIDPDTRDIVQDEHAQEVVRIDGRMGIKVIDTIPQVKDPCKVLAVGKCADKP